MSAHTQRCTFIFLSAMVITVMAIIVGSPKTARTSPPNPGSLVEKARARTFASLDADLARGGPDWLRKRLRRGAPTDFAVLCDWISDRGLSPFYGDIVDRIDDPDPDIATSATVVLFDLPAVDLLPFAARIDDVRSRQTDPFERDFLQDLLDHIRGP